MDAALAFRPGWGAIFIPLIITTCAVAACFLSMPLWLLPNDTSGLEFAYKFLLPLLLALIGSQMLLTAHSNGKRAVELTFTDRGLGVQTLLHGRREVKWEEITEIKHLRLSCALQIRTSGEKLLIGEEMEAFDSVCEQLAAIAEQELTDVSVEIPYKCLNYHTLVIPTGHMRGEREPHVDRVDDP